MATSTSHLSPLVLAPISPHHLHLHPFPSSPSPRHLRPLPPIRLLRAARRRHPDAVVVVPDARPWVGDLSGSASYRGGSDEDGDEREEEDEDEDRSLDLLVRFLHAVFRKASRRARRAARSVLPPSVPAELVKFSVNGVLVLTFLWILKGLLEVVCTFGSMVFVSILLVRGIWSGVTYIRENRYSYIQQLNNDDNRWSRVQTAG